MHSQILGVTRLKPGDQLDAGLGEFVSAQATQKRNDLWFALGAHGFLVELSWAGPRMPRPQYSPEPGRQTETVFLISLGLRHPGEHADFRSSGGDGDLLAAEAHVKGGVNAVVALRQKVPVGVDGCGDRLMSKALLDVREGHTGGNEPGDVGVP